jgi:transposase
MKQDISGTTGMTIGLDLGDRWTQVCVLGASGEVERRFRVGTTREGFEKGLGAWAPARVVLEVGTHSPWVSRWLEDRGHEVIVANTRAVQLIAQNDAKDDRADAELLARLGRADPKLLRPIRHRGEAVQRDRSLLRVRDGLVTARAALVNQARGLAKPLGWRLPKCTTEGFASRMRRDELVDLFPGMAALVEVIAQLTQQIRALEREIEEICQQRYPETALLRQVTGVGPLTSLAYVLTIEDPARFRKSRSVGGYLGLRPRRRQSGNQDPLLRITKAGDPYLRRLLVQSAHYILGRFGPDTALRRFGQRLMARGGRGARKKALIAVARKLAVLLHRLWVTGEVYEPLRGEPAEAAAA